MNWKKLNPLVGLIVLIFVWAFLGNLKMVDPLYLPKISDAIRDLITFFVNGGLKDLAATLLRTFVSFGAASILGISLGLIIGVYRKLFSFVEIIIDFFRSVPSIAFYPLFLLMFGIGDMSKIALAAFVSFWIILVNTIYGVWNSSKIRIKVARVFKCSDSQIFRRVVIYETLPQIFAGLKTAISVTLVMIIVTEMFFGTKNGIGVQIFESYSNYNTSGLFSQVIIIGLVGYLLSKLFIIVERRIIHWI